MGTSSCLTQVPILNIVKMWPTALLNQCIPQCTQSAFYVNILERNSPSDQSNRVGMAGSDAETRGAAAEVQMGSPEPVACEAVSKVKAQVAHP